MRLSAGATFGPYRILAPLGRGGMGEVYRARDSRLGRDVALKILRAEDGEDRNLLARFAQEARAASALNHPNILVVYEAGNVPMPGSAEPVPYLAMELVEGEPLTALLTGEPVSLHRMLDIATQLTDGLACAHESGIVHRDLKPSNIFVEPEGRVKILDFGLAKLRTPTEKDTRSPTEAEPLTSPGVVVGTVGYMSPEQTRGEPATPASDQFSVGCILYEMLTGQPPFTRGSAAETISSILRDVPPPIERVNPSVPAPLRWIVGRCLAKSPRDRYVSTRDLARDIRFLGQHLNEAEVETRPTAPAAPRYTPYRRAAAAAGILILAVAGGLFVRARLKVATLPQFRQLTFRRGVVSRALFAPNNSILYTASWEAGPSRSYLALSESSGSDRVLDSEPQLPLSYSGDGSQVLVLLGVSRTSINARGTLAWWPALGGKARPIMEDVRWADAAPSGRLLAVVRDSGSERVLELRSTDGTPGRTLFRTTGAISFTRFSPDEKQVAFIHHPTRSADSGEVRIAAIDGSASKTLTPSFDRCFGLDWSRRTNEIWFSASTSLFGSTLWTVRTSGMLRARYALPDFYTLQSVSAGGDRWLLTSGETRVSLTVRGKEKAATDLSWLGWTLVSDISPDDKSVLFYDNRATDRTAGIWMRSLDGGEAVLIGRGHLARFAPDGQSVVAVTQLPSGLEQLVLIPVGAGTARQLTSSDANFSAPSFVDSRTLLFVRSKGSRSEIWKMSVDGSRTESLGASGCDLPMMSPSGASFVCVCGEKRASLFVYSMRNGVPRKLYDLPKRDFFLYVRWNGRGDRIFAVTRDRLLLTLDSATGAVLSQETLPAATAGGDAVLLAAAFDSEAEVQAYSFLHSSSVLYLAMGIR